MRFEFRTLMLVLLLAAIVVLSGCSQPAPGGSSGIPEYSGSKVFPAPSYYYQLVGIPTEGVKCKGL